MTAKESFEFQVPSFAVRLAAGCEARSNSEAKQRLYQGIVLSVPRSKSLK